MKNIILILLVLSSLNKAVAQKYRLKKADEKYDLYAYNDAAEIYLKIYKSGHITAEVLGKLGDSYYSLGKYKEALKWYDKLYNFPNNEIESRYLLKYSQTLKSEGKYEEANKIYKSYMKLVNKPNEGKDGFIDYYKETILLEDGRYTKEYLPINSKYSEYGVFSGKDDFYFTSNRRIAKMNNKVDSWSDQPFFNIFKSKYDPKNNTFSKPKLIKGELNTNSHESSPIITKDGKTVYFTRSSNDLKTKSNKKGGRLKIYKATKTKGKWLDSGEISINKEGYSTAHPVLSKDEKTMYFASDIPGTVGLSDIFSVSLIDGVFGEPKNMGDRVNTRGRESFPYITEEDELYFCSDGLYGIGGFDVYYVDLNDRDLQIFNIGGPINGSNDDFSFSINSKGLGFYSNNKNDDDNIYSFIERESMKEFLKATIQVYVKNRETNEIINNAIVSVSNTYGEEIEINNTKDDSKVVFYRKYKKYFIKAEKEGFITNDSLVSLGEIRNNDIYILLDKVEEPEEYVLDEDIYIIYFDFDSFKIKENHISDIDSIIPIIIINKKIEILAYTDSRGTDKYNDKLSKQRALSVVKYLISKGVNKENIIYKGLGIDRTEELECKKGNHDCLEAAYKISRRVEFILID